jgi:hypothetical protein
MKVVTAAERLAEAEQKPSIVVAGVFGIGKTSLIRSLDADRTIMVDCEAGMLPVRDWPGRSVSIRRFSDFVDIACLAGGVDPAATESEFFSAAHYEHVHKVHCDLDLAGADTFFIDSLTEITRLALIWAQTQPSSFSERTGKPDLRSAYGLMANEMMRTLRHLQHAPARTVVFVCGVQRDSDNPGRWELQLEGNKVGRELPFVTDEVLVLDLFDWTESGWQHAPGTGEHRAFCCRSPNSWSLPAKDRSGRLEVIEEPHLGRLIAKITGTVTRED